MPRVRYTINNMPLRAGLTTAGQQGTIPENTLWQAKNMASGLDGMLSKRPGLWQWGQVLMQPTRFDDVSYYEPFVDTSSWSDSDVVDEITTGVDNSKLVVQITADATAAPSRATEIYGRIVTASQADSDDADWSVRFVANSSNMPEIGEFIVSCTARVADAPYAFKVSGTAVLYHVGGGTWTSMYTFAFADKAATSFEFRVDANGNTQLLIEEELVATILTSAMATYDAMTEGVYTEFHFSTNDAVTAQYTIFITDLMFEGAIVRVVSSEDVDPFQGERLGAGIDFKTVVGGTSIKRSLLVSGTKYVYQDERLRKMWSPLMELTGNGTVSFSDYGDDMLIFDADDAFGSKLYRWDGKDVPELMDDAPAVRFGSEHKTRLLAAGDKNFPLRLYYTASRSPNVWFAPETDADGQETIDEVLDAGYLQIPGKRGDEIVAIHGEFYGSCVIATNRGSWRLTGSSPLSYNIENISQDTGAASQAGIARMGNDLWMAGRQGITTLQTVQQFGDMQAGMPSAPISDIWSPGISNSSIKVDQYQLYRTSLAWNPTLSLMYFAFARQGAGDVSSIYAYNPVNQAWYGPWESDTTFVKDVEVDNPVTQVIMHGTSNGKVGMTDPNLKADFGSSYTATIESPYLCGRSIDPSLTAQRKTWKTLRLFIGIRGNWDINVKWQVDDESYETIDENQNVFNLPKMGTDWRIGVDPDGRIHSNQLIGVIEIPIDVTGRYFKFEISTADDVLGEELILQGYQVEFTATGPDQEQE